MDKVFAVRQVCEKYITNGKDVLWALMDLEKADRYCMWQMLRVYGVRGKLSRACVWVGNDVIDWFPVNVGLRQGCVMSPWLLNVYMDGVVER